jgi:phosphate transport system ATP-binding protein
MAFCTEIKNLSVSFSGRPALKDVTLSLPQEGVTVLLGRSGSGKTTLLRALNRLNETFDGCETEGSVKLLCGGRIVDVYGAEAPEPTELRRRVGMVFQTPNPLPLSLRKNIVLPLRLVLKLGKKECEERMEKALRDVGLWDEVKERLNSPAAAFSGGQQQRLCMARTLALEPDMLLLDEPTASVDKRSSELIEDHILSLRNRLPILVVSHNLTQAVRLGDRFVFLREGTAGEIIAADSLPQDAPETALEKLL